MPLLFAARASVAQVAANGESESVRWSCTGSPCPWGDAESGAALVWPPASGATSVRHGYTTSQPVYLPASAANGALITIVKGAAALHAGLPLADHHRLLVTLKDGESATVSGLADGEVLSVQGEAPFSWRLAWPADTPTPAPSPAPSPALASTPAITPATTPSIPAAAASPPPNIEAPREGRVIESTATEWRCDPPGCAGNWYSHTIAWPAWSAYSDNARAGDKFRRTYGPRGEVLHPYMGKWAHGCRVTSVSGVVLIIEWQRGSETWRETYLDRNETYRIDLTPPFDGAMIESFDDSPGFSVKLKNCKPQPLP